MQEISILFVDDEPEKVESFIKELNRLLSEDADYTGECRLCTSKNEIHEVLREELESDPLIEAIILDHEFLDENGKRQRYRGDSLYKHVILKTRPELKGHVYTFTKMEWHKELDIGERYYAKNLADIYRMFGDIRANLDKKRSTPFFSALREYADNRWDTLHAPAVAGGNGVRLSSLLDDFKNFYGNYFAGESSATVSPLDSLLHPEGSLLEAQELAKETFGAEHTFFITNGTSTANKIVAQTLLRPGDKVIVDRNCHISHHYGILLAGANPIYMEPVYLPQYEICATVPKQTILETVSEHKDAKALLLTNCTFDGLIYNLGPLLAEVKEISPNLKIVVDEAWFAFAYFHPWYREYSAMEVSRALNLSGIYATQSTHKTLTAFRQGSMIHIRDNDFRDDFKMRFWDSYHTHTTTSPNYGILASLDVGTMQCRVEGFRLVKEMKELAEKLRHYLKNDEQINQYFRVVELEDLLTPQTEGDGLNLDTTKILLDISRSGIDGKEFKEKLFKEHQIQINRYTGKSALFILNIAAHQGKIGRVKQALSNIESNLHEKGREPHEPTISAEGFPKYERYGGENSEETPSAAFHKSSELQPLFLEDNAANNQIVVNRELLNRESGGFVTPYPPGVPVLVPGQNITEDVLKYLEQVRQTNDIHGLRNKKDILIVKDMNTSDDISNR